MPKKSKIAKLIEKEIAAQAAASPVPVFDAADLERRVEEHKAKIAERERKQTELSAAMAPKLNDPRPISDAVPVVVEALQTMAARVKLRSPAEMRAHELSTMVMPRLEAWGFESRFRREITNWNCPEQEATFRVCQQKLCGVGAIVALIGKRGAGKTTIASQLALDRAWKELEARKQGGIVPVVTVAYRKVSSLVHRFKPLYSGFGSINQEALDQARDRLCKEVDVLVIDEWHDLSELAVREAMLIDFTDRRYAAQLDTLLISNQTPDEWGAQTPVSILSRMQQHGCLLKCEWESWREKGTH